MKLLIVFKSEDDPANLKGPQQQVFIEVEDEHGKSLNAGEWTADGEFEQLTIDCNRFASKPLLGLATTAELIAELAARAEVGGYAGYRAVDSN